MAFPDYWDVPKLIHPLPFRAKVLFLQTRQKIRFAIGKRRKPRLYQFVFLWSFSSVNVGPGSTIHNHLDIMLFYNASNSIKICDVKNSCFLTFHLYYISKDVVVF